MLALTGKGHATDRVSEKMDSRLLFGFNATYGSPDGTWSFGVYGENVLNEVYDTGRLQQSGFVGGVRSNDRSEFGIRLTKSFGG